MRAIRQCKISARRYQQIQSIIKQIKFKFVITFNNPVRTNPCAANELNELARLKLFNFLLFASTPLLMMARKLIQVHVEPFGMDRINTATWIRPSRRRAVSVAFQCAVFTGEWIKCEEPLIHQPTHLSCLA